MKRKKLIISILVGAAVASAAIYLMGTKSGKKEWSRLKKTGSSVAAPFKTLGKEVARNANQARKEEERKALKAYVRAAVVG